MEKKMQAAIMETGAFLHSAIQEDLAGRLSELRTRFPPEPGGHMHLGNAKAIYINFELARAYGGKCNLRMDDTNPSIEKAEYAQAIQDEIKWLGYDWEDRLYFASDYFEKFYECAVELIGKGLAFVCDLSADRMRESFGSIGRPGTESPCRGRSVDENLDLFGRMRAGEFADGAKTLRAKIDMASPNLNMRDPVIYRIMRKAHSRTGDKWCIYPMYDFAHPLEDAIEGITHSLCSIEFEDHRPLYDWYVGNLSFPTRPRQIEFAKISVSNTVLGKRFLRPLIESKKVDGWDDPRLVTVSAMRRRGYPAAAIREFLGATGVSKAESRADFAMLEHFVREHLAPVSKVVMAVLSPVKVTIENYPDGREESLRMDFGNGLGERDVPFCKHIYIEAGDFMEQPAAKFFRLAPGREVRLKGAYCITCKDVKKGADGKITEIICEYDPATKSGQSGETRKVKGTIHWVSARHAAGITAMLYETLVLDAPGTEDGVAENPDSLTVMDGAAGEPYLAGAAPGERFQFMRQGYFCLDTRSGAFNRTVSLKSSYRP